MTTRASITAVALIEGPMQVVSWLRQSGAHGAWIGVWSLAGFGGTIASPALLATPVVLMFLAPRAMFLAVAAPNLPLLPFLALGLFRLTVADASYFVLGSRVQGKVEAFGVRCRSKRWWSPAGFADRCARWICHSRVMAGVVLFFRPSGRYIGIASAYGVPAWIAAWTSVTGTVLYLLAMHHGAQWLVG